MTGGASSKRKGSAFERSVCTSLSLWISKGQHDDLLWRSAMSGGRGTRRETKHGAQRVSGDICAVAPGGHVLTDHWHIECKHVKNMNLTGFVLKASGFLATEWKRCVRQAKSHKKLPMMIVRENNMPAIVLVEASWRPSAIVHMHELGCSVFLLWHLLEIPFSIPRARMPDA
jgi:hypothetical protein